MVGTNLTTRRKSAREDIKSRSQPGTGGSKFAKLKKIQGKIDEVDYPSYIEINGKLYNGGTGTGNKKRAEEEVGRFKEMYGDAFILELKYYRVYGLDTKETKDMEMLKTESTTSGKKSQIAKDILNIRSKNIMKL